MRLYEYEGKQLFRQYHIPVLKGILVSTASQAISAINKINTKEAVLKAQVLHGKRGKAGLIQYATKDNIKEKIAKLLNICKTVLIEEKVTIIQEKYMSIIINPKKTCYTMIFSEFGGMDIEDVPNNKIIKYNFIRFNIREVEKLIKNKYIATIAAKLFNLMIENDATFVEINPLALIKYASMERFIALDAKVTIDTNALYRHPQFQLFYGREHTKLETQAQRQRIHYVELDGDIAVIGNGAGLVMSTLDTLEYKHLKPANFCDAPGGTQKKAMIQSLNIVIKKKGIKALFINMFGGMTKTDEVAEAIVSWKRKYKSKIPMIIRIYGTNYKMAHKILKEQKIKAHTTIEPCISELRKI